MVGAEITEVLENIDTKYVDENANELQSIDSKVNVAGKDMSNDFILEKQDTAAGYKKKNTIAGCVCSVTTLIKDNETFSEFFGRLSPLMVRKTGDLSANLTSRSMLTLALRL